jgi:hypothetical protein
MFSHDPWITLTRSSTCWAPVLVELATPARDIVVIDVAPVQ